MTHPDCPYGFRVVGPVSETRRLVDAAAAFSAHCLADPKSQPESECYLSAFRFGADFRNYLDAHGTPKGYAGACWSPWLWLDLDRPGDPASALADARRLAGFVLDRYPKLDDDGLLLFFSGGKGYHVGVPLPHTPEPGPDFHRTSKRLAEGLAAGAGVRIDTNLYDRVRLFRAPNSCHPKTRLHKRRLTHKELFHLSPERISDMARGPAPFDELDVGELVAEIESDWAEAAAAVAASRPSRGVNPPGSPGGGRLQRATSEFLAHGAEPGERTTRLFRAAANLREFAGPPDLIRALLTEPALDSGMPPAEVERVIGCGIAHADAQAGAGEGGAA